MIMSSLATTSAIAISLWLVAVMYLLIQHPARLAALMLLIMGAALASVFYSLFLEPRYPEKQATACEVMP